MSADPLADLLAEMTAELYASPYVLPQEAEWLRANRDRVLEALGGLYVDADDVWCGLYGDADDVWWFPKGPVE